LILSDSMKSTAHIAIIRPVTRVGLRASTKEFWHYREVLYFLVWRDVKIRYKQTVLGIAWAVLPPLLTMVAFTLFLGQLSGISPEGLPYSVFVYSALIPWSLFSRALVESSNSLVANQQLLTKIYFPRVFLPIAPILTGLLDFGLALLILLAMMLWHGVTLGASLIMIVPLTLLATTTAFTVGIWLSAINLRYRDVRHTLPFVSQLWFIATPVVYSSSIIDDRWRGWYAINPMVGVIDGFRWSLLGLEGSMGNNMPFSVTIVLIMLAVGLRYFNANERRFADVV
jgi:lipopolysaccharide transport system permease protein